MPHILDNMIWNAINTGNKDIAIVNGNAGCYQEAIAPFAGVKEWNEQNMEYLFQLLPPGRKAALSYPEKIKPDENKWQLLERMPVCQMVYEYPVDNFTTGSSSLIVPLGMEHVPQMMALTALTKPGPFFEKTILLGNYFGILINGQLAAMAGQRMHPVPYMEVSAVCTHPDFRGKGHAKAIMLHVMQIILNNSFIPFLHVLSNNTNAIRLYESIGFRVRKELSINIVRRLPKEVK